MIKKFFLTLFAACDKVMTIMIPLAVAILLIIVTDIPATGLNAVILMVVAIFSALFRGIKEVLKAYD